MCRKIRKQVGFASLCFLTIDISYENMANYKYCGKGASIFSHTHKDCEEKHGQGITILGGALRSYFHGTKPADELRRVVSLVQQSHFIAQGNDKQSAELVKFRAEILQKFG